MRNTALLSVSDLVIEFHTQTGVFRAVDGVSFQVKKGETLGVVGESGCGKSVTALSIMGLVPDPPGRIASGSIRYQGEELLERSAQAMESLRGGEIAMVSRDSMTSLNPLQSVAEQLVEAIRVHETMGSQEAWWRAVEMLRKVRIPDPEAWMDHYPGQISPGLRQRVMIAMALICQPRLLIADEPTTALDVTIQAQILELLRNLRGELGISIILITHDLAVVAELAQRVVVMYAGTIVEEASVISLFRDPQHPYTLGLLGSIPRLSAEEARLATIEGTVPDPHRLPSGCRFHPRCPFADQQCRHGQPPLEVVRPGHRVACWHVPLEKHFR